MFSIMRIPKPSVYFDYLSFSMENTGNLGSEKDESPSLLVAILSCLIPRELFAFSSVHYLYSFFTFCFLILFYKSSHVPKGKSLLRIISVVPVRLAQASYLHFMFEA